MKSESKTSIFTGVIELDAYFIIHHLFQGTVVEGTIQQLFEGHHMNYIECINVDYKSTRKESFYGIPQDLTRVT